MTYPRSADSIASTGGSRPVISRIWPARLTDQHRQAADHPVRPARNAAAAVGVGHGAYVDIEQRTRHGHARRGGRERGDDRFAGRHGIEARVP